MLLLSGVAGMFDDGGVGLARVRVVVGGVGRVDGVEVVSGRGGGGRRDLVVGHDEGFEVFGWETEREKGIESRRNWGG